MCRFLVYCLFVLHFAAGTAYSATEFDRANRQLHADIDFLTTLRFQGTSPQFKRTFGRKKTDFVAFLNARIKTILWEPEAPLGVLAFGRRSQRAMVLTQNYASAPLVRRLGAVIHETKHLEADGWPHVICPTPFNFSYNHRSFRFDLLDRPPIPACDSNENGAYGLEFTFLQGITESCANCSDEIKKEAAHYAITDGLLRVKSPAAASTLVINSSNRKKNIVKQIEEAIQFLLDL